MATSKPSDDKTTASKTTAKASGQKTEATYSEQAASLADAARALVEDIREKLTDLTDQFHEVQQTEPTTAEGPVADGARRIPMSVGEVHRALEGLHAAAAELQQRAAS